MPGGLRLWILACTVAAAGGTALVLGLTSASEFEEVADGGRGDAALFVVLSAAAMVALVPPSVISGVAGLLFGSAAGAATGLVGVIAGSTLAFLLARGLGGDALRRVGGSRVRRALEGLERRGFAGVPLARVVPGAPFAIISYAAGLTRIGLVAFTAATALGYARAASPMRRSAAR